MGSGSDGILGEKILKNPLMMRDRSFLESQQRHYDGLIQQQPRNPKAYVQRGMVRFKQGKVVEAIADFDEAERLQSDLTPYLWQRGLAYYYCDRFAEGARQFEIDLTVNARDVEETVWRYLCLAQLTSPSEAQKDLKPVRNDPRAILRQIYALFAGECTPETVLTQGQQGNPTAQFYSHLYVGLYGEAQGDRTQAQTHITQAATEYKLDDYMWYLAWVHGELRGWL